MSVIMCRYDQMSGIEIQMIDGSFREESRGLFRFFKVFFKSDDLFIVLVQKFRMAID